MLKLKRQYFGHLMRRADSFDKTLMLGKTEGRRRRDDRGWDGWMTSLTRWTWVWGHSRSCWWTGRPGMRQSMGLQTAGHDWATELNWTEDSILGFGMQAFRYKGKIEIFTWVLISSHAGPREGDLQRSPAGTRLWWTKPPSAYKPDPLPQSKSQTKWVPGMVANFRFFAEISKIC